MVKQAMVQWRVLDLKIFIEAEVIEPLRFNAAVDFDYVIGYLYRQLHEDLNVVRHALHAVPRLGFTRELIVDRHAVKSVSSIVSLTSLISGF